MDWAPLTAFLFLAALAVAAYLLYRKAQGKKEKPKPSPALQGKQILKRWAAKTDN